MLNRRRENPFWRNSMATHSMVEWFHPNAFRKLISNARSHSRRFFAEFPAIKSHFIRVNTIQNAQETEDRGAFGLGCGSEKLQRSRKEKSASRRFWRAKTRPFTSSPNFAKCKHIPNGKGSPKLPEKPPGLSSRAHQGPEPKHKEPVPPHFPYVKHSHRNSPKNPLPAAPSRATPIRGKTAAPAQRRTPPGEGPRAVINVVPPAVCTNRPSRRG